MCASIEAIGVLSSISAMLVLESAVHERFK